jgi:uncharacterized protein (DUF1800 family)
MALDPKTTTASRAALALHRFGLGPRSGSIAAIASDPRGALIAELERPDAGRIGGHDLLTSAEAARAAFAFQRARVEMLREARRTAKEADKQTADKPAGAEPKAAPTPADVKPAVGAAPQEIYLAEANARLATALAADIGFAERLVWFWSNHFCVSADKGQVRPFAGAFEREAIRGHLRGHFGDMLRAVETHPAMLLYLDNARSIGPHSPAGINRHVGLNENLAREILELHTLGVRTVYSQADVTNFAKVITGWTIIAPRQDPLHGGEFTFNPRMHEPGPQAVIGKVYPEGGFEQGERVLADLARHPATAKHIATKLVRHFVADDPPRALVERLSRRFMDTEGNLREIAKALVNAPEAWEPTRSKLKHPTEWIVAALRAVGTASVPDVRPVVQAQNLLGEPLWRVPAPNGFGDDNSTWLDGLSQRLDVANQFARRIGEGIDPMVVFEATLAPIASTETRQTIARAESRPQALALLFMAPEFQRR